MNEFGSPGMENSNGTPSCFMFVREKVGTKIEFVVDKSMDPASKRFN
jgi:hypothetical protein